MDTYFFFRKVPNIYHESINVFGKTKWTLTVSSSHFFFVFFFPGTGGVVFTLLLDVVEAGRYVSVVAGPPQPPLLEAGLGSSLRGTSVSPLLA